MSTRGTLVLRLAFFIAALVVIVLYVRSFSGPLFGTGDTAIWEYLGYYVSQNLTFLPWPSLDLVNDQVFYPYGVSSVFQAWGLERDLFFSLGTSLIPFGPWLQLYFALSLCITMAGVTLLLRSEFGELKALIAGFCCALFNFYALHKFPGHYNISVLHWSVLSVVTDFVLYRRYIERNLLPLKLLLVRALLTVLSLSQDMGYIAGISLLSLTVTTAFILAVFFLRMARAGKNKEKSFHTIINEWKLEALSSPWTVGLLTSLVVLAAFLYLPLVLQIFLEATSFQGVATASTWSCDLTRLLLPYFPFLNPSNADRLMTFQDNPEGFGAGSTGWFLLIIGILGLFYARRRISTYLPLLTLFALFVANSSLDLHLLKVFPWYEYARVSTRFTLVYPIVFILLGLTIPLEKLFRQGLVQKGLLMLLAAIGLLELYTAIDLHSYTPLDTGDPFYSYMETVESTPGEAVLDWPFCIAGGNGFGTSRLGPFYHRNNFVYALRRFHGKKVLGQYFGRLHPLQIRPYLLAGWDKLFVPDHPSPFKAMRQKRCFTQQEWLFFHEFFLLNDFAGINLYPDLLPDGCAEEFYARYGQPLKSIDLPRVGRMEFIPKPDGVRGSVDKAAGRDLKFLPPLQTSTELVQNNIKGLNFAGFSTLIRSNDGIARMGIGPASTVMFSSERERRMTMTGILINPIPDQRVAVVLNGKEIQRADRLPLYRPVRLRIPFTAQVGTNTIDFQYAKLNRNNEHFFSQNLLGGVFYKSLKLEP